MNFFIFGAGFSGAAIGRRAVTRGLPAAGTSRSLEKTRRLEEHGLDGIVFGGELTEAIRRRLAQATHLVISIAPGEGGDPVLRVLSATLGDLMPRLAWIGYLSTVGVYGDRQGGWVDETADERPVNERSRRRLDAEQAWLDLGATLGLPAAVLRLSGIYGPGRNAISSLAAGKARRVVRPGQVFNRIHVEDIAAATMLLAEKRLGGLYNVTDDEPGPPQEVIAFAAETMGVEPPPEIDFDSAELSPMARSFWATNKRVSNAKLKAAGYRFIHPNYRRALECMWHDGSWQG